MHQKLHLRTYNCSGVLFILTLGIIIILQRAVRAAEFMLSLKLMLLNLAATCIQLAVRMVVISVQGVYEIYI